MIQDTKGQERNVCASVPGLAKNTAIRVTQEIHEIGTKRFS